MIVFLFSFALARDECIHFLHTLRQSDAHQEKEFSDTGTKDIFYDTFETEADVDKEIFYDPFETQEQLDEYIRKEKKSLKDASDKLLRKKSMQNYATDKLTTAFDWFVSVPQKILHDYMMGETSLDEDYCFFQVVLSVTENIFSHSLANAVVIELLVDLQQKISNIY